MKWSPKTESTHDSPEGFVPPAEEVPQPPLQENPERRAALAMARYRDGYFLAGAIDRFGSVLKVVALIVGGLIALAGLIYAVAWAVVGIVLLLMGVLVGGLGYVLGVLVQAAGQLMKALFDVSVNGSHFLSDDQRAHVMSLE